MKHENIQKHIEDALAEKIINSSISEGDHLFMDFNKDKNELHIEVRNAVSEE